MQPKWMGDPGPALFLVPPCLHDTMVVRLHSVPYCHSTPRHAVGHKEAPIDTFERQMRRTTNLVGIPNGVLTARLLTEVSVDGWPSPNVRRHPSNARW